MAKSKKIQNGVSVNPKKELTQAQKSGEKPISAWWWVFSNFSWIIVALFGITPFGLYKAWGTGAEWVPIISFILIGTISFVAASKQYKQLVKGGYIKKFGE
jgi:hypothetical protein